MDIVELIKREHAKTTALFDKLADTSTGAVKTRERLFGQLKTGLEVHGKVVQDLVYPLLRKQEETRDLIPDLKERNEVKRQLADLERTPKEDEAFLPKLKEFKKVVEQHLRTEQRQIFPAIKKAIGGDEAEELAKRIAAETREELQEAKQEDGEPSTNGRGRSEAAGQPGDTPRRQLEAEHVVRVLSRGAQRVTDESAETAETAVAATVSGARRATETAARQMEHAVQSIQGATQIYAETSQRATEGLRTLMAVPNVAANAFREAQRAWADLYTQSVTRTAQLTQEMLRCSNPQDMAAAHREFLDETINGWLESNVRVLQATRQATDDALRPLEEQFERAQQEGRRQNRRRNKGA
jgi:hemerythrin superfamily protein